MLTLIQSQECYLIGTLLLITILPQLLLLVESSESCLFFQLRWLDGGES